MKSRFKIRNLNTYDGTFELKSEKFSKKDIIDRTGYIPLELQLQRMLNAGQRLTEAIDRQFSQDYQYVYDQFQTIENALNSGKSMEEITASDSLKQRFMDKCEVDELYKRRLKDLGEAKTYHEKFLKEKYENERNAEIERIKKEAINEYIAQRREKGE